MPSLINSDDGVVSGSAGLKTTGGNDGILVFQSSGTETARITSGVLAVSATSTTASTVRLYEDTDNGSNYVDLIAPTSVASNRTITLPDSTGTVVVGSAAVSAVGQIPFSIDGSSYTPTAKIVSGTAQTAPFTDNTRAEFTGIPSWAKRITVMLQAVGTNGSSVLQVQVGSGSFSTSGYTSQAWSSSGSTVVSTGIYITSAMTSAYVLTGMVTLCLVGSNTWVATGLVDLENTTSIGFQTAGRTPALSGALDRIRVLAVNGTDTFDTGSVINIFYE